MNQEQKVIGVKVGVLGAGKAARQRVGGLPGDGPQPRQRISMRSADGRREEVKKPWIV